MGCKGFGTSFRLLLEWEALIYFCQPQEEQDRGEVMVQVCPTWAD